MANSIHFIKVIKETEEKIIYGEYSLWVHAEVRRECDDQDSILGSRQQAN